MKTVTGGGKQGKRASFHGISQSQGHEAENQNRKNGSIVGKEDQEPSHAKRGDERDRIEANLDQE